MRVLGFVLLVIAAGPSQALQSKLRTLSFDGATGELAVQFVDGAGNPGLLRTQKLVLITERVPGCAQGCIAEIRQETDTSFSIAVGGLPVAQVLLPPWRAGILPAAAFGLRPSGHTPELYLHLPALRPGRGYPLRVLDTSDCAALLE